MVQNTMGKIHSRGRGSRALRFGEGWFPNEFASVDVVTGRSVDVLENWEHGSISVAFLDGSHAYGDVSRELALLDGLVTRNGVVVVDDYHIGEVVGRG